MSPDDEPRGSARSAAEINDEIRDLWARAGGSLTAEQRAEYAQLVVRWADARRAELATTA